MEERKKVRKKLFNIVTLVALFGLAIYLISFAIETKTDTILIHFFDVGQGDSAFIELPGSQNILIDGGPNNIAEKRLDREVPFFKKEIKNIILTHPHADHFTGLLKIVKDYKVDNFYMSDELNNTPEYQGLLNLLIAKKVHVQKVKTGDEIQFPQDIKLKFLFPVNADAENINNSSVVSQLEWGKKKVIFMGDLESEAQVQLLPFVGRIDLVKVSHHCSADAILPELYQKLAPSYSVISVGKDNNFGHPSETCINLLKNSQVFRTDEDGQIDFEMNKNTIRELKKSRF